MQANQDGSGLIGTFDEDTNQIYLSKKEVTRVHKKFQQLDRNRQDAIMEKKKAKRKVGAANKQTQAQEQNKPKINVKSEQIAAKKNPKTNNTSYIDYLINRGKEYENKRKQEMDMKESQEVQGLTFQPNMDRQD